MEELLQQSANGDQSLAMPKSTLERPINSENPATIGRSGTTSIEEEINLPRSYEPVQGDQDMPNCRENKAHVRRWYYYRGRYCKATEVKERAGRRLVLRRIATRW
jgi:hypothetical protein